MVYLQVKSSETDFLCGNIFHGVEGFFGNYSDSIFLVFIFVSFKNLFIYLKFSNLLTKFFVIILMMFYVYSNYSDIFFILDFGYFGILYFLLDQFLSEVYQFYWSMQIIYYCFLLCVCSYLINLSSHNYYFQPFIFFEFTFLSSFLRINAWALVYQVIFISAFEIFFYTWLSYITQILIYVNFFLSHFKISSSFHNQYFFVLSFIQNCNS